MVFRIFDNILATGVEALLGFSLVMLQKNEEKLLAMKFDEMVAYLNNKIFDTYRVRVTLRPHLGRSSTRILAGGRHV